LDGQLLTAILLAIELALVVAFSIIILLRRHGDSVSRAAWLVLVILLPIIGAVLYLLIGEVRLGRSRIRRHRDVVLKRSREATPQPAPSGYGAIPERFRQVATLAEAVGGNLPREGNRLELFGETHSTIDSIVADIQRARHTVHLLTYIYLPDQTGVRVADALAHAAARGVECRVLVDGVGSKDFLESPLRETLEMQGVRVVAALPVNPLRTVFSRLDLRNHRKITVVDGRIGYTGSQNIADAEFAPKKRYAPWVDCMVRVEGPAAQDLDTLFAEDWYLDTDEWIDPRTSVDSQASGDGMVAQVIGTGPNVFNNAVRQLTDAVLHLARDEIILTTPYFVPDESTVSAMTTAARRGVRTILVVPERNDSKLVEAASRSYYDPLLDAGVEIHAFQSGLLHAKTLTIDRDLAIVTSANLDRRSFLLNFEATLLVFNSDFASQLRFLQKAYMASSVRIDAAAWAGRAWPRRLWHNAAGLFSPLL